MGRSPVFRGVANHISVPTLALVCLHLLSGCPTPYLNVEPKNMCPGTKQVVAKWYVKSSNPKLSSSPKGIIKEKSVPNSGSESLSIDFSKVPANGKFWVEVNGQKEELSVVPAGGDNLTMSFVPDCKSGTPKWYGSLLPSVWGSNIKIKNVANFSGREIKVTYAGKMQNLPKNSTSNAWNGMGLTVGNWSVWTKLEETNYYYEACNPMGGTVAGPQKVHKLPPSLQIVITYGCQ